MSSKTHKIETTYNVSEDGICSATLECVEGDPLNIFIAQDCSNYYAGYDDEETTHKVTVTGRDWASVNKRAADIATQAKYRVQAMRAKDEKRISLLASAPDNMVIEI